MIGENRAVDTTTLNTTQRWKLFQELLQYLEILKHTWTCDRCGKKRKACQNNINSEKDQSKHMCKKVTSETSHMEPSKKTGDVEQKWRSFPKRQFLEKIPSDIPENHHDNRKPPFWRLIYISYLKKHGDFSTAIVMFMFVFGKNKGVPTFRGSQWCWAPIIWDPQLDSP